MNQMYKQISSYKITHKIALLKYKLSLQTNPSIYKLSNLKYLEPMSSCQGTSEVQIDSQCYEVEAIRDRKTIKGKYFYNIKWKGWDEKDNTWEPIENLATVSKMVKIFDQAFEEKKTKGKEDKKDVTHEDTSKKTKIIEKKLKKQKKDNEQDKGQDSDQSQQSEDKAESKGKTKKIDNTKKRSTPIPNQPDRVQPKQKSQPKEKQPQRSTKSTPSSTTLPAKPFSFSYQSQESQITRINYHILVPSQTNQVPQLCYNVDRRNKLTKKPMSVMDIPAEELLEKCPLLIIQYLEKYIIELQATAIEERENEREKKPTEASGAAVKSRK